jgi:hypothetical protein
MDFEKIFMPFSNWKVVLLSFLGATTFWFFSALGKQYSTGIRYPIEFIFDRDSLVLMQPLTEYVDLEVTGGGWDLFRQGFWFGSDPILITPENPVSTKYFTRASLLPFIRNHLGQFQINFLYTDTIYIDIDRKISKKVTLNIDSTAISLDENYRMVSPIQIEPDTAIIYGPTSFIDTLQRTITIPIESNEIDRNFDRFISLGLPDAFNISSDPNTINVTFEVERFDDLQLNIELEPLNFPADSSAYPSLEEVNVSFTVQRSLDEDFFTEDFKVIIDYDMINKADSTSPAILMIYPENALDIEIEPDTIKIQYRE